MIINFRAHKISWYVHKLMDIYFNNNNNKILLFKKFFIVYIYLLFADNESDWFTTLLVMQLSNAVNQFFHELFYFPELVFFLKKITYHNY